MGSGEWGEKLPDFHAPLSTTSAALPLRCCRFGKVFTAHGDVAFVAADFDWIAFFDRVDLGIGA